MPWLKAEMDQPKVSQQQKGWIATAKRIEQLSRSRLKTQ